MNNHRLSRIESLIMRVLSEMTAKRMVRDPRVNPLVTFSYAKISPDLHNGEVGIAGYMSKTALRKSATGLNHAAGYMQSYIAKQIRIRTVPHLHFVVDTALGRGFETVRKLMETPPTVASDAGGTDPT